MKMDFRFWLIVIPQGALALDGWSASGIKKPRSGRGRGRSD
jgi:hypothetical protein